MCFFPAVGMAHRAISITGSSCKPVPGGRRGRRVRHVRLRLSSLLLRLRVVRLFGVVSLLVRCLEELSCCPPRRCSPASGVRVQRLSQDRRRSRCRPAAAEGESSFHAEAIADCLEFIKRSYLPVQDDLRTAC
ncbi:hypothetical protein GUJ93_ZPchr0006g41240 [Zizania palustris]|uniref:Uncharacterized protein n=1 Tax=Zizania palustris TaxID=103762 RepID=A0A8J5W1G3_ZIZPA|nr:hypothetical protein GUJ93_ZPchr0006g41240 [Zizania palustris]